MLVKGGRVCLDLGNYICDGSQGGIAVWVGDVDDNNTYWEGLGSIPPQGGPQSDGAATL